MTDFPDWFTEARGRADRDAGISHKDGIWYYDAPLPPKNHECTAWTVRKDLLGLETAARCACGAIRLFPYDSWLDRNSRRRLRDAAAESDPEQPRSRWSRWTSWGRREG